MALCCECPTTGADYPIKARRNGWSCPPNPLQFVAWFFTVLFIVVHCVLISPSFVEEWQPFIYIPAAIIYSFYLIFLVWTTHSESVDPAGEEIEDFYTRRLGALSRQLERPINYYTLYCFVCKMQVGPKAKHCALCQKCIGDFDHHCRWLNNCIGARNYRLFIATLVSAIVGCLFILVCCITLFVCYFVDEEAGDVILFYHDKIVFKIFYVEGPQEVWLTLVVLTAVLLVIALVLLCHLLLFHVKLYFLGISTYEYIVKMRKEDEERAREKDVEEETRTRCSKPNQVAPDLENVKAQAAAFTTVEEDEAGELAASGGGGACQVGETPPPTPPPPVMPTPPMSTKKLKQRNSRAREKPARQNSGHYEVNEVPPLERSESSNRRKKRRRKRVPPPYALDNEGYEPYDGIYPSNGPRIHQDSNNTLDDTKDLQKAIENMQKKERKQGSSGPSTAANSRDATPHKRAKKPRKHHHPTQESTLGFSDVNYSIDSGGEKPSTPSSDEDEVEPPPEGAAEVSEGSEDSEGEDDDDDNYIIMSTGEMALRKVKNNTKNKNRTKVPEQEMLLEDILEPADVPSLRKDENSNIEGIQRVGEDSVLALGVEKNAPIVERLELPLSSDSEGENPRKTSSDPDLHSSTRSYSSRVDVEISPNMIKELPPVKIKAAGPAKEYNSDSAESLTEIPVSSTRTGNMNSGAGVLYSQGVTHGGYSRSTLPAVKKVSKKKKKHSSSSRKPLSPSDSGRFNNSSSFRDDLNSSGRLQRDTLSSSSILGATDISMGTRTLPSTEIVDGRPPLRRQRSHKDVPPLDLSELSGNSDNETATHSTGKKKKKSVVTKI